MKISFIIFLLVAFQQGLAQQKEVAITIDDVPNPHIQKPGHSILLELLKAMQIPVTIFINEKNLYENGVKTDNVNVLESWLKSKNVTVGNHSFSHLNYADTTLEFFQRDIINGEIITSQITHRRPRYFRFPFNSLGKDSVEHARIKKFLSAHDYIIAPFTIESEDWAFSALYDHALENNDLAKAKEIGERYITQSLSLFNYFEKLTNELYGRNIRHIYLCHDNQLNTDYMSVLVKSLKNKGYSFISLNEAMDDKIYESSEHYTGKYGFSWIYRWEKDEVKRKMMMRAEPVDKNLEQEYSVISNH